jgi:hypothetical protein
LFSTRCPNSGEIFIMMWTCIFGYAVYPRELHIASNDIPSRKLQFKTSTYRPTHQSRNRKYRQWHQRSSCMCSLQLHASDVLIQAHSTGATGYIGGDTLYALYNKHPEYEYTALVRTGEQFLYHLRMRNTNTFHQRRKPNPSRTHSPTSSSPSATSMTPRPSRKKPRKPT